jgi:hypothetical protein
VTFALCLSLLIVAIIGPLPDETGWRSKVVITRAVTWCVVMLALSFAVLVLAKGWPS